MANVQDTVGAREMLTEFSNGSKHLLVLQETRLTNVELRAYVKSAKLAGWNVYHQGGQQSDNGLGASRENGGVMIMVKK